ncbi:ribbon-helix-helix domain-containing protein [Acetobacter fallax]|uniref:Arylsulfate sulfotransferase n=1 Tax=Acetobacter fallax TaxID=1737473 RepID=A0ABX0KAW3_9PROT|nr:ribbon-helix-helix domain-containing protein [Acetobacter fallax]NHO32346.1 arylsulfate sulfotransferase [Acetobacter fallax]NHO35986.1 arylsulfate sulfotransferase [Acetobacter fallax]
MRHLAKRSLVLSGHGTSVALEPEFWDVLDGMAAARREPVARLVESIDVTRDPGRPLASALRVAVLNFALSNIISRASAR